MEIQNKRVRFYIRATSHTNQHRQLSDLSLFAQRHMIPFEHIYFDKCESNQPRHELNRALEEFEQYEILIIHNNAILHIDSVFAEVYADVFRDKGIQIINLTQEQMKLGATVH